MSYADQLFIQNCKDILTNGVWDTDHEVRPVWEDGTPAHTIKKFGIVNRYDLRKEFPVITLRRTYFKSAVDELLWIWQKKSNNVHDLKSHIWDSWADETGSIGKAYAVLMHMFAQASGLKVGELVHVIADAHIYDRHIPMVEELLKKEPLPGPTLWVDPEVKDFYQFTTDSFKLENYQYHPFDHKVPVAI